MYEILAIRGTVGLLISLVLFVVKVYAFADALTRRPVDIQLRSQLSKQAWLIILGLSLAAHALVSPWNPLAILNLLGTLAALVYLAQIRGSSR